MDYTRYLIQIIYLITLFAIFNTSDVSMTNVSDFRTNDDVSNMLQSMFVDDLPSTWSPNSPNAAAAAAQFYSTSSKIIFLKNSTYCTMYSKRCFVRVIIGDLKLKKSLKIRTQSRKIIEFKSIESCSFTSNNSLVRKECKLTIDEYNNNMNLNLNSFLTINGNNNISRFGVENFFLIRVRAKLVGIRNLEIEYLDQTSSKNVQDSRVVKLEHRVIVTRPDRFIDTFQVVYIVIFSILISVIMGILLDVSTLIKIIKMPIPVLIGFISQYLVMPLLTYAFIHIFKLQPVEALALFIYGCSPGGSGSNNWTIIFNGDIDLSAIMTFVSTMTSIVMMPFWMYTLGKKISYKAEITIPIGKLVLNLFTTIAPCLLGLLLSQRFPIIKQFFMKVAKKLVVVLIISFLLVTLAAKYYVFKLVTWEQWITGPLIPWSGFILGAFLAWISRRPSKQIFTISIETGLQNVSIAYLIIMLNFPSPQSDYALLPLIAISFITTVPLWVILFFKTCIEQLKKILNEKKSQQEKQENLEQCQKLNVQETNTNV